MNGAAAKPRANLKNDRMRSFHGNEEDSFIKRRRQNEKNRGGRGQRVKITSKAAEVTSRTQEEKRELDISKGISDMLISYEPDFGYEERIDFASMPDPNHPGQQLTQHCSGWTMLLDEGRGETAQHSQRIRKHPEAAIRLRAMADTTQEKAQDSFVRL